MSVPAGGGAGANPGVGANIGASAVPATPAPRRRTARGGRSVQYLVLRVTGVMLAVLALGHFALTHVLTDVADTDSAFIARRWSSALWIGWDGLLLGTALLHGLAGLASVVRDHRPGATSRARWLAVAAGGTAVLFVVGVAALTVAVLEPQ